MECRKCGAELAEGVLFCRECGTKVETIKRFCRECGAELNEGTNFCPNCGTKVEIIENFSANRMVEDETMLNIDGNDKQSHTNADKIENIRNSGSESMQKNGKVIGKQSVSDKIKIKLFNIWKKFDIFCKIITVALLITIVMLLVSVILYKGLSIFISIIQIVEFMFALLLHKKVIKSEKIWLKYVALTVAILMSILNILSYSFGNNSEYEKADNAIGEKVAKVTTIRLPVGKDDCIGKKYSEIESVFSECGFVNISLKPIEDLKLSESDKVGQIDNISIDGTTDFEKNQTYQSDAKITINYHAYAKCVVNVHINFIPNLIFNKYDVKFNFDGANEGTLTHGESVDYQLTVEPGEYAVEFVSKDSSSVKGKTTLKVNGDVNVSYKIECHSDEIFVEVEYTENLGDVGENEIMMSSSMKDYKYNNYKDVEKELKKLGFTNIKTKILYDIELGWTDEGETESVSINGKDDFKRGDIFANSDEVIITYHMKAEDDPVKKKEEKKTDMESKQNLTVDNCSELADMLSNKAEIDQSYSDFASKYKGRTIEFDGRIDYCVHYKDYDTRFDYIVSAGNYDPDHQIGPSFKFENVNYYDLHTDIDTVSVGKNVHIVAKVEYFDTNSGLFYLDPVAVTKR